ncbi:MAG: hypothetical protein QOD74_1778 [Variibacter sp.]|jgi:microcystin-dependent protein|nr:hypothetical protein [Variibacter sp.]
MAEPYVGEIRCFGFNFAPRNWAFCNGQLLPIASNTALFSLLGTTYGGNGQTTFALPDLRGRGPMHWGSPPGLNATDLGEMQGAPTVTLGPQQMPAHNHTVTAANIRPGGAAQHAATPSTATYLGPSNPDGLYKTSPTLDAPFSTATIGTAGGSVPHENMQPYLAVNFCIALSGIFPARN